MPRQIDSDAEIDSIRMKEQSSAPATPDSGYGQIYCKSDGLYYKGDDGTEIGPLGAAGSGGYTEGARVYKAADQTISDDTVTAIQFDNERYDTDGIHDNATNNTRLTCQTAGKYLIGGCIRWETGTATQAQLQIRLNGTTTIAMFSQQIELTGGPTEKWFISTVYDLAQTDYVELVVYQDSTGTKNIVATANYSPEFWMQRIG